MILFDLLCSQGHGFEAWFRGGDSFDRLASLKEIRCAVCGDTDVKKALMAPRVRTSKAVEMPGDREEVHETAPPPDIGGASTSNDEAQSGNKVIQERQATLTERVSVPVPEKVAEAMRVLREVQSHIEKTFDHVGKNFAEEARKMHYGETEKRSIYGEATPDEAEELGEEGIEVNQMPWLTTRNS